jgi:hypothetical protein
VQAANFGWVSSQVVVIAPREEGRSEVNSLVGTIIVRGTSLAFELDHAERRRPRSTHAAGSLTEQSFRVGNSSRITWLALWATSLATW